MNDLAGKHIVLGLTGGIACYKAAEFCRGLVKAGAMVQVVMTEAAAQFITPVTMQALSGRPVFTSQWDAREGNNMPHINLSREADAIVIAPASADFLAKLLHGRADDLLSLLCLARPIERCPLIVAPAMNREMYAHPATQRNLAQLRADLDFTFFSEQTRTHGIGWIDPTLWRSSATLFKEQGALAPSFDDTQGFDTRFLQKAQPLKR